MKRGRNNNSSSNKRPTKKPLTIANLPPHLRQMMIFSRLPTRNMASVARVSRNFRNETRENLPRRRVASNAALAARRRTLRKFYENVRAGRYHPWYLQNRNNGQAPNTRNTPNLEIRKLMTSFPRMLNANERNRMINYLIRLNNENLSYLRPYNVARGARLRNAERYNPYRYI